MKINRKEFLLAMKAAMPGIESGNCILEGADTFIFDKGFIHSYNDNISVSIPFPITNKQGEKVSGAIKAKEFYDLINRYPGEEITLIPKDTIWIIKSENAMAEFTLLENTLIDKIKDILPKKITWNPIPKDFINGIAISQFSNNKSILSGIFVKDNIITSTDEIRINWYDMKESINDSFWITDKASKELINLNIIAFYISDSWVHFQTDNKSIFSCKRLDQTKYETVFEKIKALLDQHKKEKGDISNELPGKVIDAINRAAALSTNIESFNSVKLTFTTDYIEVYAERPSGKYTEKVNWDKPFKKEVNTSIFVDYAMIEHGIIYSNSFYLKTTDNKGKMITRIIFVHKNGIQLINTLDGGNE